MTIQGLHVICLALTPTERWNAAGGLFKSGSAGEVWLTIFAVVALIVAVILLFYVIAKHKRMEHFLEQNITELTSANNKLMQEIAELGQAQVQALENACRVSGFYDLLCAEGGSDYAKMFVEKLGKFFTEALVKN